jgi:hypothetical protein
MLEALKKFLSEDRDFYAFCQPINLGASRSNSNRDEEADWIRDTRREFYSYLYFIQSVREAFGSGWRLVEGDNSNPDHFLTAFELLADARREIETDAAAGWRRTTQARTKLGLKPCVVPKVPQRAAKSSREAATTATRMARSR